MIGSDWAPETWVAICVETFVREQNLALRMQVPLNLGKDLLPRASHFRAGDVLSSRFTGGLADVRTGSEPMTISLALISLPSSALLAS